MSSKKDKFYFFANWKMYLDFDESNILANALANEFSGKICNHELVVFPSSLALYSVTQVLNDVGIKTGIQNGYWVSKGGYTGEISFEMAQNAGCSYALVGHSERRHQFGETNHEVRKKIESIILNTKLIPVLCVGETQEEKDDGKTLEIIEAQLRSAYDGVNWDKNRPIIIAYEPVWAIGTGNACNPTEAQIQHKKIRTIIKDIFSNNNNEIIILYGGSVDANNVGNYLDQDDIDGVLVGGASTKFESWLSIVRAKDK